MCCSSWPSAVHPYLAPKAPQSQVPWTLSRELESGAAPQESRVNMPPPTAISRSDDGLFMSSEVLEHPNVPRVPNCRVTLPLVHLSVAKLCRDAR